MAKRPIVAKVQQLKWAQPLSPYNAERLFNDDRFNADQSPAAYCKIYREKGLHHDEAFRNQVVDAFSHISVPI